MIEKKIQASLRETNMFEEELLEIKDQLDSTLESTLRDIDDKLELLIEMLKNRIESVEQTVKQHYKKQGVFMKEAMNNLERRKQALKKLEDKVINVKDGVSSSAPANPGMAGKIERFEEEFIKINRSYDSPFHHFKHCVIGLNPQNAGHIFENIGSIKNPVVSSTSSNTYQYFITS